MITNPKHNINNELQNAEAKLKHYEEEQNDKQNKIEKMN